MAKYLTLGILTVAFIIVCVGSFLDGFNMDAFTKFLMFFSPFYLGLVVSIGGNSAIEKIQEGKK